MPFVNAQIENNIIEIKRCNQRGDRMLSIVDLIQRDTFDLNTAAYLMCRIHSGTSFITGAVPGGAGKTTVMCALMNLIPSDMQVIPAENSQVIRRIARAATPVCALAHEISAGSYYCYIWGQTLRDFFGLTEHAHTLVTNLHADDLEQTREQICSTNGVAQHAFDRVGLFIFLRVRGGRMRRIIQAAEVLRFDERTQRHVSVFPEGNTDDVEPSTLAQWRSFAEELLGTDVHTIENVRQALVQRPAAGL